MKDVQPFIDPAVTAYIAAGLMTLCVLIGLRFTYRAFLLRFVFNKPFNNPKFQAMADQMPPDRSMLKALAAYGVALLLAWFYFAS